jgi:hypothetical protein
MICDQCETVVHCTKHGCIPKQPLQGMTVIEMAREAGIHSPDSYKLTVSHMSIDTLKRFEALVRADEREACAKVCDSLSAKYTLGGQGQLIGNHLAAAIRARGNT